MTPNIGRIVHYVLTKGPSAGQDRAAIVTFAEEGSDKVSLTAFPAADRDGMGATFSAFNVPFSAKREHGTWHWPSSEASAKEETLNSQPSTKE